MVNSKTAHRTALDDASSVIFDFDGVLADSEEFQLGIWRDLLVEDGLPVDGLTIASIAGIPDREAIENAVPGLTPSQYDALKARKVQRARARTLEIDAVPEAARLLESLRHKRLHVCSSSDEQHIREFLARKFPHAVFEQVVGRGGYKRPKPQPDPYLAVLEKAQLSPLEAVVIEDSQAGVMAARAAGLRVIRLDRYCREPSDDAICSLSELLA